MNRVTSSSYSTLFSCVIVPFFTFDSTPPPTKYFTVIVVFDGDEPYVFVFKKLVGDRPFIGVFNKTDLGGDSVEGFDCSVSAKTGDGIGELKKMISKYFEVNVKNDFIYMVKERHIDLFSLCLNHLKSGFNKLENDELFEIVAEDLKISRGSLDSILGKKSSDDLLGDIFNNFCIGK